MMALNLEKPPVQKFSCVNQCERVAHDTRIWRANYG